MEGPQNVCVTMCMCACVFTSAHVHVYDHAHNVCVSVCLWVFVCVCVWLDMSKSAAVSCARHVVVCVQELYVCAHENCVCVCACVLCVHACSKDIDLNVLPYVCVVICMFLAQSHLFIDFVNNWPCFTAPGSNWRTAAHTNKLNLAVFLLNCILSSEYIKLI